jgi:hypothetical protein
VKYKLLMAASAFELASLAAPADAQHMDMPGMQMPMPTKPAAKKKTAAKKASPKKGASKASTLSRSKPSVTHAGHEPSAKPERATGSMTMPMEHDAAKLPSGAMPTDQSQAQQSTMPMDHQQMDHSQMQQMAGIGRSEHAAHEMTMTGALGSYPMTRESSGTAWQPDASEHMGLMSMSGDWTLMAHGIVNFVYNHQSGARGDDKAFASGMLMGMARRRLGNGTIQFRAALSPDPLMGAGGYPLLLASGETANGRDRLIDRQHPHDFFMELSGSVSQNLGPKSSVFLYAGLPGEPAFGPPAFMHREAILDSPEAPISHHWLDSTHISFGVLTAGVVLDRAKLEVSRFNGREPDQHRWNIETGPLDSTAVRVSWNPTRELSLQGSWGHFTDPEQLEPGVDQKRWSASVLYAREIGVDWKLAGTLAWGRKTVGDHKDNAIAAEASVKHAGWTLFGRSEMTENRELLAFEEHGPAYRVGKISVGAVRDFRVAPHVTVGAGGLFAVNFVPVGLKFDYCGSNPTGMMGFVRLKLD